MLEYIENGQFLTHHWPMFKKSYTVIAFYLFLIALFATPSVQADFDYGVSGDSRITPSAAQIEATIGYGFLMQGSPENENPFYSYIRPSLTLGSSSTMTGIASLDIYPVSFFGFTIGKSFNNRFSDLPGLDCGLSDCRDWLNYSFFQTRFLGKYKNFLGSLLYEKSFYDDNDQSTTPYADGTNVVFLAPQGEEGSRWQGVLAYTLTKEWALGIYAWDFRTKITQESNDYQLLILRRSFDKWSVTLGAGRFGSSQYGVGPQGTLSFSWTGQEKIGP